ncbi:hypothetical protein ABZ638_25680 [Streptomyces sp. NPDC007107]|uniref:hypothetical protein n=1 Tax=Streptomyces sp. NPDC007107 TaxID=3156915 RepID=UPI0033EA4D91
MQHISIDLSAGPFLQVGPPAAHWATSRDLLRVRVTGSNVRQGSVPAPAIPLVVLSSLVNIPPWSRGLPASQIGDEVLSGLGVWHKFRELVADRDVSDMC